MKYMLFRVIHICNTDICKEARVYMTLHVHILVCLMNKWAKTFCNVATKVCQIYCPSPKSHWIWFCGTVTMALKEHLACIHFVAVTVASHSYNNSVMYTCLCTYYKHSVWTHKLASLLSLNSLSSLSSLHLEYMTVNWWFELWV